MSSANRKDTAVGSLEHRVTQLEDDMQFMKVNLYFTLKNLKQMLYFSVVANFLMLFALAFTWWG